MESRICNKCKKIKPFSEFNKSSKNKDGIKHTCKDCRRLMYYEYAETAKELNKKRYIEKRGEILAKTAEYKKNHAEFYKNYFKSYYEKHKTEIKISVRENSKKRKKDDVSYKILCNCRTRIYKAVKGINRSERTIELIGCSIEKLMEHLESQFKPGMTWENYGKWHIDHIRPCASFDLSDPEQQKDCFNWKNLQPLWAEENFTKHARYEV